jgi:hypothetical protein
MAEYIYSRSSEKLDTHKAMWPYLKQFIDSHESGYIATMPADSGKQENEILDYLDSLPEGKKIKLCTFDNQLDVVSTNVKYHPAHNHHICDVFSGVKRTIPPGACFIWFDLCGALTDRTVDGLRGIEHIVKEGYVFVTLQIHGCRGLQQHHIVRNLYNRSGNTPEGNLKISEELVASLLPSSELVYSAMYRRNTSTYCVLGLRINPTQKQTTNKDMCGGSEKDMAADIAADDAEEEKSIYTCKCSACRYGRCLQRVRELRNREQEILREQEKLEKELDSLRAVFGLVSDIQANSEDLEELLDSVYPL